MQPSIKSKHNLTSEEIIVELIADDLSDVPDDTISEIDDNSDVSRNSLDRPKTVYPLPNHSENELSADESSNDETPNR